MQFTPASGAAIVRGQPVPSGTFTATGAIAWTRAPDTFSLTLTTPVALVYDATCTQAQRITAGELRARGSFNGTDGYLRVQWSACGVEPSIVFVAI